MEIRKCDGRSYPAEHNGYPVEHNGYPAEHNGYPRHTGVGARDTCVSKNYLQVIHWRMEMQCKHKSMLGNKSHPMIICCVTLLAAIFFLTEPSVHLNHVDLVISCNNLFFGAIALVE